MCKFQTVTIPTDDRGNMDINEFKKAIGPDVAVVMITNPNTLGLYEENLSKIKNLAKKNDLNYNSIIVEATQIDKFSYPNQQGSIQIPISSLIKTLEN